jgi:signal transduction histidine kinase
LNIRIIPQNRFDRELDINELLKGIDQKKIYPVLKKLLGESVRLIDTKGNIILGQVDLTTKLNRIPLTIQIEPIAYIESEDEENIQAVALLLEQLLKSSERYHMASDLHLESVHADFEKLQNKHEALIASEKKYKELAENLEQRVQQQVKTIDSAQRQLYQAEKLASVGQLAAGVAHEINNPVGFIRSNLSTADDYVKDITQFAQQFNAGPDINVLKTIWQNKDLDFILKDFSVLLKESIDGADRVKTIVSDLKDFSNVDGVEVAIADINKVIRSVCNVAKSQVSQKADLELSLKDLPKIKCQSGHLGQVFLNMIQNASQAIKKEHGKVNISSAFIDDEIVIKITDNGCGMNETQQERIFDPFYTTQDVGSGTGLGLSVSMDIIRSHDGRIEVESQPGQGSTFIIYLPVRE